DRLEKEREHETRQDAADHPADSGQLRAEQAERSADVACRRERRKRPREQPVLVQRDHRRDHDDGEEPPAAEVDGAENDRQQRERDEDARKPVTHRPPNLRRRDAYSARAWRRSRSSKSGQSLSTKTSSE